MAKNAAWTTGRDRDPTKAPQGCAPVSCMWCGGEGASNVPRAAVGPLRGLHLRDGELGTMFGETRCRVCHGRGWVWGARSLT